MNYSKIMRRIQSHPKEAIWYLRRFTSRHRKACIHCGCVGSLIIHSTDHQGIQTYVCKECHRTFSELYGTIFYRSKVSLWIWLSMILDYVISTGSVSAAEISRRYGIRHATIWKMFMKIRTELLPHVNVSILQQEVESDEAWFGKQKNQDIIMGMVQRQQRKLICKIIPNVKEATLYPIIRSYVQPGSTFYTDQRISYAFTSILYHHKTMNHSQGKYGDGEGNHSNTIEQIWGDIKGIIRTIHHGISKKYRPLYLAQYIFRYENKFTSNLFSNFLFRLFHPTYCVI